VAWHRREHERRLFDGRPSNAFWLDNELVDKGWIARLGVFAWAVLCVLVRRAGVTPGMPGIAELTDLTGVSRSEVKRSLKLLRTSGLLRRLQAEPMTYLVMGTGVHEDRLEPPAPESAKQAPALRSPKDAERKQLEQAEFDRVWKAYPKRPNNNRQQALKAWRARIKEGASVLAIYEGTMAYASFVESHNIEPQYIKQAATFFGPNRHWENDYPTDTSSNTHSGKRGPSAADEVLAFYDKETVL
jgi:hypothetical protein